MEKKEPRVVLSFLHNVDAHRDGDDGASVQSAVRHMNADYRNAVAIDGHTYKTIGWNSDGTKYDDRVWEAAPDGSWTLHETVRDALRKHRK